MATSCTRDLICVTSYLFLLPFFLTSCPYSCLPSFVLLLLLLTGADLTPYYLFNEDAEEFHKLFKDVCDGKYKGTYDKCKRWCDDYFYLPARQEHRGVGGIFFDDLSSLSSFSYPHVANKGETKEGPAAGKSAKSIDEELDDAMAFTQAICDNFMPSYIPIVKQRRDLPYTEEQVINVL